MPPARERDKVIERRLGQRYRATADRAAPPVAGVDLAARESLDDGDATAAGVRDCPYSRRRLARPRFSPRDSGPGFTSRR
jgi:hypothetical protein